MTTPAAPGGPQHDALGRVVICTHCKAAITLVGSQWVHSRSGQGWCGGAAANTATPQEGRTP